MATAEDYGFIKPTDDDWLNEGDDAISANADTTARLVTFMEGLAAEPGSRLENFVYDPLPADAPNSYFGGNVAIVQAPGWGRSMATAAAGVTTTAYLSKSGTATDRRRVAVQAGQPVAARIDLRAMNTQKMSATLSIIGWKTDGSTQTLFTSGQLDIEADATVTFQAAGVIPVSSGVAFAELRFTFRRYGETYPALNDYVFFRKALLVAGSNAPSAPPVSYFDGNSSGAYWASTPNVSRSIMLRPRSSGGSSMSAGAAHLALVDEWSHRMGGKLPIGKTTSISVRIDHGLNNFNAKLRPILDAHNIPYTIALGADSWGIGENNQVSPATVNGWAAAGNCDIAAHGWGNHLDTADETLLKKYIVEAKAKLEADLPAAAPVDIFMPPGAGGNGSWGGFLPSLTPDKYAGTYAGQLALSTYPICSGQFSGTAYRVQDGTPRIGQAYLNMDQFTDSQVLSRVNTAVAAGQGVQLMIHPNLIDSGAGYITTAQLSSLFSQLKTMHNAGTVRFMSVAQQYLADSTGLIDTGWRNLSALAPEGVTFTNLFVRRVGNLVHVSCQLVATSTAGNITIVSMPSGFKPSDKALRVGTASDRTGTSVRRLSPYIGGLRILDMEVGKNYEFGISYLTDDPAPTVYPGTVA